MRLELDTDDYVKCQQHSWFVDDQGYWRRTSDSLYMHVFLMGKAPQGMSWDHIDGDKNNNKKDNFRLANQSQQMANQSKRKIESTSRYKGVYYNKQTGKWIAQIKVDYKARYLGSFILEEDAAKAYDVAARAYFGKFARTNF